MAEHNLLGHAGEEAVCRYLVHKGYRLRDRNWRYGHLELDVVAEWLGEIVFIEVKTRSHEGLVAPRESVTHSKRQHLLDAGAAYLAYHRLDLAPFRFDVVEVVGTAPPFSIRHIENAFTAWGERRHPHRDQH